MSRFAIQNAAGLFHSGNLVPETIYVPRAGDPSRADPVSKLVPQFETANLLLALKYDQAADATAMLAHPDLADPSAFEGCKVVECEFDSSKPLAIR